MDVDTSQLVLLFTVIGGFAGGVYLIEVLFRMVRRLIGAEDEALRRLARATALEVEERFLPPMHR